MATRGPHGTLAQQQGGVLMCPIPCHVEAQMQLADASFISHFQSLSGTIVIDCPPPGVIEVLCVDVNGLAP